MGNMVQIFEQGLWKRWITSNDIKHCLKMPQDSSVILKLLSDAKQLGHRATFSWRSSPPLFLLCFIPNKRNLSVSIIVEFMLRNDWTNSSSHFLSNFLRHYINPFPFYLLLSPLLSFPLLLTSPLLQLHSEMSLYSKSQPQLL